MLVVVIERPGEFCRLVIPIERQGKRCATFGEVVPSERWIASSGPAWYGPLLMVNLASDQTRRGDGGLPTGDAPTLRTTRMPAAADSGPGDAPELGGEAAAILPAKVALAES